MKQDPESSLCHEFLKLCCKSWKSKTEFMTGLLREIIEDPPPPYEADHMVNDREEFPKL